MLCSSKRFVAIATKSIIEDAGEGIILQKPKTEYIHGRTSAMLKFKVFLFLISYFLLIYHLLFSFPFSFALAYLFILSIRPRGETKKHW
jgi:hypothetical protein